MIQTVKTRSGALSVIARVGVKYIPFQLDDTGQDWIRQQPNQDAISAVDLAGLVLSGQARPSNGSAHARLLKRIEEENQMPLNLDFSQSFLSCEATGRNTNLYLCLIHSGSGYDLKVLTQTATALFPVEEQVAMNELSLPKVKEFIDRGRISLAHPIVKRLKHWFAGRMEVWGLAYG